MQLREQPEQIWEFCVQVRRTASGFQREDPFGTSMDTWNNRQVLCVYIGIVPAFASTWGGANVANTLQTHYKHKKMSSNTLQTHFKHKKSRKHGAAAFEG